MGHASTYLLHMPSWVLGWHLILDARHASQALVTREARGPGSARLSIVLMAEKIVSSLASQSGPLFFGETVVQRLSTVFARDQTIRGWFRRKKQEMASPYTHTLSLSFLGSPIPRALGYLVSPLACVVKIYG